MAAVTSAVVAAGATVAGVAESKKASRRATRAQSQAAKAGISEQRLAREAFEDRTDPFRQVGLAAASPILSDLGIAIPEGLAEQLPETAGPARTPLFDFLQQEGFEDIQESAAAQGRLRSGGTLRDLSEFNTSLAGQFQNQRFNQLFNLLGLGSNVVAGQGTASLQTAGNISNLLDQAGQAKAGGALGQAKAFNQGVSDLTGVLGAYQGGAFGSTSPAPDSTSPAPDSTSPAPTIQNLGGPTGFGQSGFAGTFWT